jgi:hypothetical protein
MRASLKILSSPKCKARKKFRRAAYELSEFAQMPHKGTPIRYGQKQPVQSRQQGAEKISPRRI